MVVSLHFSLVAKTVDLMRYWLTRSYSEIAFFCWAKNVDSIKKFDSIQIHQKRKADMQVEITISKFLENTTCFHIQEVVITISFRITKGKDYVWCME